MKDLIKLIGQTGNLAIEGLEVGVKILDVRESFGRTDVQITPLNGSNKKWVSLDRVTVKSNYNHHQLERK